MGHTHPSCFKYQFPVMRRLSISSGHAFLLVYRSDHHVHLNHHVHHNHHRYIIIHDYIFWQHRRSQFIAPCSNEDRGDSPAKKRFQGKDSRFPDQYQSRNSQEVPIVLVGNKVDLGSEAREVVAKNMFRFICPRTGQNLI